MKMSDIQNLTVDNVGTAPLPIRAGLIAIVCIVLLGLAYW